MNIDIIQIAKATTVLFAIIDIIGSIPIVMKLKKNAGGVIESEKASLIAGIIMLLFLYLGEHILKFIGIDVASFGIAGSLIIFFMALEMVLGVTLFKEDENTAKTASIVPLAFPLIAGAGSMTSILSLRAEYETINIAIAIVINIVIVYAVLKLSGKIERFLGKSGIAIIEKVFGIILLAIAVKLFVSGIKTII